MDKIIWVFANLNCCGRIDFTVAFVPQNINEGVLNDNTKEENIKEENIKEVKILSKKDKKNNNEKKIARYLGVNVSVNEFKNNKDKIKKMLLHKSIANV